MMRSECGVSGRVRLVDGRTRTKKGNQSIYGGENASSRVENTVRGLEIEDVNSTRHLRVKWVVRARIVEGQSLKT